jgi:hypothetical protein
MASREKIYVPAPSAAGRKEGPDFGNSERQVHRRAGNGKLGKTREESGEKKRGGTKRRKKVEKKESGGKEEPVESSSPWGWPAVGGQLGLAAVFLLHSLS